MRKNNCFTKGSFMIIVLITIVSSLVLISCNSDELNKDIDRSQQKIVKAELTNKEKSLLNIMTNRYLAFDILKLNNEYKRMDIWVDYYENGELKGKQLSMESSIEGQDNVLNRILLVTQAINNPAKEEKWILSAIDDGGNASGSRTIKMPEGDGISSGWQSVESVEIVAEEIINLGAILIQARNEDENSSIIMSSNLLEDEAMFNEHIAEYDYAYILKCKFSKEKLQ